jgi:hypothetical protein
MNSVIIIAIAFVLLIPTTVFAERGEAHWSNILEVWKSEKLIDARTFLNAVGWLHDKKIINYDDGKRNISSAHPYDFSSDPLFDYTPDKRNIVVMGDGGAKLILTDEGWLVVYVGEKFIGEYFCSWC